MTTSTATKNLLKRWRQDPVAFAETLVCPETSRPFSLYEEQKTFLRRAFTLREDGTLPYGEVIFGAPKKSGKTALAAIATLYAIFVQGGSYAEGYCIANDLEQAQGRVFQAITRILQSTPMFQGSYELTQSKVTFPSTGSTITALASDYAGAAGSNPTITIFDELWAYTSERARRLFDEHIPPPTRKVACRLTVTYAGFEGESELLEELYRHGRAGEPIDEDTTINGHQLTYWTHDLKAPWQTDGWAEQMRGQLRKNAYLRLIENRWVTTEGEFVPVEWWDRAATGQPLVSDKQLPVTLGVDAGLKRDTAAVAVCSYEDGKVRLVSHRIYQPTPDEPLDLEETLETAVRDYAKRFSVTEVRYDPWQFARSAQTLAKEGLPMSEFPQSVPNLTRASQNLYELLKGQNLTAYPDDDIRRAISHAVARETSRGWRIAKEKQAHKIDVVVALGMAALGAIATEQQEHALAW